MKKNEGQEELGTPFTFSKFIFYFLQLGATGFGGPVALVGYMQQDLVEKRKWITSEEYKEGLALAQLAPGPLAAQLAIYLGWVKGKNLGATLVGIAFILPSFLIVLILSSLYIRFGGLPWMTGAFYGVGASVMAIMGRSAYKLVTKTAGKETSLKILIAFSAIVTVATETEYLIVFLLSGIFCLLSDHFSKKNSRANSFLIAPFLLTGLLGEANSDTLTKIFFYFVKAGTFVFGSGLAIVPFLHGSVVNEFHWLNERQFLDAVAVAMITPGPVIITVAFIGYLVAGLIGASLAALGVFLPCYLLVVFPAPYYKQITKVPGIKLFIDGVTAAAIGAIVGSVIVLGRRAITDIPGVLICLGTLVCLLKLKKIPEPFFIIASAIIGIAIFALTGSF